MFVVFYISYVFTKCFETSVKQVFWLNVELNVGHFMQAHFAKNFPAAP